MQQSTTTVLLATSQGNEPMSPLQLHNEESVNSNRTKTSRIARLTSPLKKASSKIDQTVETLRPKLNKSDAVEQPRFEGEPTTNTAKTSKDEAKEARREARRAKWAARWDSLKKIGSVTGKALLISGAVVFGFIVSPIIVALDIVFGLLSFVVGLLMELGVLFCIPFLLAFEIWWSS